MTCEQSHRKQTKPTTNTRNTNYTDCSNGNSNPCEQIWLRANCWAGPLDKGPALAQLRQLPQEQDPLLLLDRIVGEVKRCFAITTAAATSASGASLMLKMLTPTIATVAPMGVECAVMPAMQLELDSLAPSLTAALCN